MSLTSDAGRSGLGFHVPFLIGDALLLIAAWVLFAQGHRPLAGYEVAGVAGCVAFGAWLGVWPWVLRHRAELRRLETTDLNDAVARIGQLEDVARQVSQATNKWQTAHDSADRVVRVARELSDRILAEQADFRAFLEKANDAERQHLRLELEKARRDEGGWLQVLIFLLDHTFALFKAASRSGQQNLINQIGRFQDTCLDAARRVGLTALAVEPGTGFDAEAHVLPEGVPPPAEAATINETLAPGYRFQGRLLRKPLVGLGPVGEPSTQPLAPSPATEAASFTTSPSFPGPSDPAFPRPATENGEDPGDNSEVPPSPS